MTRKTAASAIQSRHITAQIGICAFDGVSLFFAGLYVVESAPFALPVDQFFVRDESIAEELSDLVYQSKGRIDQRLHGLVSALFNDIEGQQCSRFTVDDGG